MTDLDSAMLAASVQVDIYDALPVDIDPSVTVRFDEWLDDMRTRARLRLSMTVSGPNGTRYLIEGGIRTDSDRHGLEWCFLDGEGQAIEAGTPAGILEYALRAVCAGGW